MTGDHMLLGRGVTAAFHAAPVRHKPSIDVPMLTRLAVEILLEPLRLGLSAGDEGSVGGHVEC